jgi:predicted DCC family thiol-disulfide oxidoreductase YuxK
VVGPDVRRASAEALHVITTAGRVLRAGRASLFVLGEIGWPRTARVLAWPPFVWAVELGYGLVARNRGRISRWFPNSPVACRIDDDRP